MGDPERVEVRPDGGEVVGARVAQPIDDPRRAGIEHGHRRILRIEQSERVALEPVALGRGQLVAWAR